MFSNFTWYHLIIIAVVILVPLVLITVGIIVVVWLSRRSRGARQAVADGSLEAPMDVSARLAQLDDLRRRNQITDAEYQARRRAIVDGL